MGEAAEIVEIEGEEVPRVRGRWTLRDTGGDLPRPKRLPPGGRLDLSGLEALDTVGAEALARILHDAGAAAVGVRPEHAPLFDAVRAVVDTPPTSARPPSGFSIVRALDRLGARTIDGARDAVDFLGFIGLFAISALRLVRRPGRVRLTSAVFHIQQTGVSALPILGLLTFLIGVVLAFQGASQLQRFGAEIYVVDLLGVSILREIGALMTAIIVAGRSGSAFTAQIGAMRVSEEVDAIQTLGLDPMEILVMPRVLALAVSLPLLVFFADVMGLAGGALMCWASLEITPLQFIRQLGTGVDAPGILVGLVKAPVFAVTIALVGCHAGLRVSRSAESVGKLTTQSVVRSIFLVIILDAAFSILFAVLGI